MCLFVYPYSQQHYSQHLKCGRNSVIHWGNEWISKTWYMYVCVYIYTHIYNGPLFSLKKEGDSDIHYDMDEYWGHSVKWNKPDVKDKHCLIHLYERHYLEQSGSQRHKGNGGCEGLWGVQVGSYCSTGRELWFGRMERAWGTDSGDGCVATQMSSAPMNCTHKNG